MISHGPPMPTDIDFFQVKRWNHQYVSRFSAGDLIDCIHMLFDSTVLQRITLAKATQMFLPPYVVVSTLGPRLSATQSLGISGFNLDEDPMNPILVSLWTDVEVS